MNKMKRLRSLQCLNFFVMASVSLILIFIGYQKTSPAIGQPSCDGECQRFRRFMNSSAWPAGKPKAVIYVLTHKSRLVKLQRMLKTLDEYFNVVHDYPLIIFHESDLSDSIESLKTYTSSEVFFQLLRFEIPPFLNKSAVPNETACDDGIGYRHMCHFHSKGVYDLQILRGLEYAWRLDDDSYFTREINYDLFVYMKNNSFRYGYFKSTSENFACIVGLWDAVDRYALQNGFVNRTDLRNSQYARWPRAKIYFNNFEISDLSIWFSDSYQRYIDYIYKQGGVYYHRWGDAPIKTIALMLFVSPDKIYRFKDLGYHHYDFIHPMP